MARKLRYITPNTLVEITLRTIQQRFLIRPSSQVNLAIKGSIGRAQRYYGMKIVCLVFLSNHFHLLLVPESAEQLARFMQLINGNLSKQLGEFHGWRGQMWECRYKEVPVAEDEADHVARLVYLLEHGVKEGLVSRPQDWPGVNCVTELMQGTTKLHGIWHEKERVRKAARAGVVLPPELRKTRETLELSRLPAWESMSDKRYSESISDLVESIIQRFKDRKPLGIRAILAQHPHHQPLHSKRSAAPMCHASNLQTWLGMRAAYHRFAKAYRKAALLWSEGRAAEFPVGCFLPTGAYIARDGPIPAPI